MSWAAHNPEKYSEIVCSGLAHFVTKRIPELNDLQEELEGILSEWECEDRDSPERALFDTLFGLSISEIGEAEGDYFGGLVDDAMNHRELYKQVTP